MAGLYGIYKDSYGELDGHLAFVVATDGEKVGIIFPSVASSEDIEEMRRAIGARVSAAKESDPEELLLRLTYNMPVTVSTTAENPLGTYEEAEKAALDLMAIANNLEDDEIQEVYEPIIPMGLEED